MCGWQTAGQLPHEATFSRAFAEFANSELPQRLHEALITDTQQGRIMERFPWRPTLERFLRTWPDGTPPKIHYSSPRTQMRELVRTNRKTGKQETVLRPPVWTAHADYIHPFEFIRFAQETQDLDFDVMLEAKAKDLALYRLRADIACYAPELQERFDALGTTPDGPVGSYKREISPART